jgi:hypothetical protein
VKLPDGLSSLISSYVVDSKEIWLPGILGDSDGHPNLLVHTGQVGSASQLSHAPDAVFSSLLRL